MRDGTGEQQPMNWLLRKIETSRAIYETEH
jgi:hypothetical protein